jgi:hypothetical protein
MHILSIPYLVCVHDPATWCHFLCTSTQRVRKITNQSPLLPLSLVFLSTVQILALRDAAWQDGYVGVLVVEYTDGNRTPHHYKEE